VISLVSQKGVFRFPCEISYLLGLPIGMDWYATPYHMKQGERGAGLYFAQILPWAFLLSVYLLAEFV